METSWRLEPVEDSTLFAMEVEAAEGTGGMFGKLAEPLVRKMARRGFEANLAKLKDLMVAGI